VGRLEGNVNYLECLRGKGVDVPVIADDDSVSDPDTLYYPDSDDVEAGTPVQGSAMAPNHTEAEAPRGTQRHPEAPRSTQKHPDRGRHRQRQKHPET